MTTIGFLGLGIMGSRMAANLQRNDLAVSAWTHSVGKAEAWAAQHEGATAAATPAEAAANADIVISMVVDGAQVRSILLDGDDAAASGARPGTLFVDMSTIAPADARAIGAELAARGHRFVDAPVTGSSPRAEDGTLTIMAGGEDDDIARAQPAFAAMGETIVHVGALGHAQTIKLINNAVSAANAATLAQALVMGAGTGVDLEALTKILAAGSGNSTMVGLKAAPMRQHAYATLFKTDHMLKDVRLCLEEAQAAGVPFPAASAARDALVGAVGRGYGDADFAAIVECFEGLAGLRIGDV
ncbi:2-hydroxy-3-oxopropionate reductase [Baekduia alba]|uniref:NAD(P)-dependent oxidoreductase n=1 Tax=Baekduia alba TaxID=2997333 RepID=UPI0023406DFC|nr:NAD(P)-dependent oxidoreductase [Baekduia alba]WCB95606.1 2-hydroxy-3-oxopropionate reductase [Baekduia alba]